MNIAARIDELVNRGFDNGLIAAVTGVDAAAVADFRRTRVAPQDPESAFAHLTEQDNTGPGPARNSVKTDERFAAAVAGTNFEGGVYGPGYAWHYLHAGAPDPNATVYELWTDEGNGSNPIFSWNEDGSLHWSDGTNPSNVSLGRTAQFPGFGVDSFASTRHGFGVFHRSVDGDRTSNPTASVALGDADFVTGIASGVEVALSTPSLGQESWPAFLLTDYDNYSHPIWGVYPSGKMVWSAPDGLSAPDIALHRRAPGSLAVDGDSLLGIGSDFGFGARDSDTTTMSADLGVNQWGKGGYLNVFAADDAVFDDPWKATLLLSRNSDNFGRFMVTADGAMSWSDGVNPPDIEIHRTTFGMLQIGPDAGGAVQFDGGLTDSGYIYAQNQTGEQWIEIDPAASGFGAISIANTHGTRRISVDEDGDLAILGMGKFATVIGGGLRLHSADGTAYAITVTNDGTLDVAAA